MKYLNYEGKEMNSPETATHYSLNNNGTLNQFYRYQSGQHTNGVKMLQYYSIFNEWKKSNLTPQQIKKLVTI